MARPEWTDEFVTLKRQVGDVVGDQVIWNVYAQHDVRLLDKFMAQLVANDDLPPDLPADVTAFLAKTSALPPWADRDKIRTGVRLFNVYGAVSLVTLVCASLPECYTMQTGVRILDLTSQLGQHTNRRLHQTAALVLNVMGPGGFEPQGMGIRQTQKVRLIHAAIRCRIQSALSATGANPAPSPDAKLSVSGAIAAKGFDWQMARDGRPINQEDLAFTLLTFGHVIPKGMRTLGIKVSDEEYEAFMHCWNVSGYILGVDEDLMAHTVAEAEELFALIKSRQAGSSPAGERLTDSLLSVVENNLLRWRVLQPAGPILMRVLVGDRTAGMLGLNVRHGWLVALFHRVVATLLRAFQILIRPIAQPFQPVAPLAAKLGLRVVDYLCLETDDGKPRQVAIPPEWR